MPVYSFNVDGAGVLKVETTGFWNIAIARTYIAELRRQVSALRDRYGYSLVLVDGRETAIQQREVMAEFSDLEALLISTDKDRAAYVVSNSLAKAQGQRLATSDRLKVFLSPSAARTWLTAYESSDRK